MSKSVNQGLSLYIHIPFCRTRCTYCDFNTYTNLSFLYEPYTRALCNEIERTLFAVAQGTYNPLAPLPPVPDLSATGESPQPLEIETIFFGGGTPSLLPPALLGKILASVRRFARLKENAEITVEANPGTLSASKLHALKELGVNRLSFGVQTFNDESLRLLGRTHDSLGAIEAFKLARAAGFENLSLDFIYGLPDQTLEDWGKTLDKALELRPEHLSAYGLTVEENTSMGRGVLSGKIQLPDEDTAADMYLLLLEKMEAAGYKQYEISNWARDDAAANACRHNLVYWHNEPYIGFGPGAHSSFAGYRYPVLKDPKEYIRRLKASESVIETDDAEPVSRELRLADSVILALRLNEGLRLSRIEQEFGQPLTELYPGTVEKLLSWGLLEEEQDAAGERILRLTVRGRLLSNNVFIEFLPD